MAKSRPTRQESPDKYLQVEYSALADFFGRVITFRFTTAAFFIAAVAFVIGRDQPQVPEYILLFAMSLGIWIVELRNRAIYDNLARRAFQIEDHWIDIEGKQLPFFTNMLPKEANESGSRRIPRDLQQADRTRILIFGRFAAPAITHTLGLDILYLSVMGYALWSLLRQSDGAREEVSMNPVFVLVFWFGIAMLGFLLLRAMAAISPGDNVKPSDKDKLYKYQRNLCIFYGAVGGLMIIAAALFGVITMYTKQ